MLTVRLMELEPFVNAALITREIRLCSATSTHVGRIHVELMQTVQLTELVQFVDVVLDILGTPSYLVAWNHAHSLPVE